MVGTCLLAGSVLALVVLGVAGFLDARFREIDPEIWYGPLLLALPIGACHALSTAGPAASVFYVSGLMLWLVMFGLYLYGMMGGGDVFATLLLVLSLPAPPRVEPPLGFVPPVLVVLLLASLMGLMYRVWRVSRVVGFRRALTGLELELEPRRLLEDPVLLWWVPRGVGVEEEWSWELAGAKGRVRAGPGTPLITFMALALAVYLLVFAL